MRQVWLMALNLAKRVKYRQCSRSDGKSGVSHTAHWCDPFGHGIPLVRLCHAIMRLYFNRSRIKWRDAVECSMHFVFLGAFVASVQTCPAAAAGGLIRYGRQLDCLTGLCTLECMHTLLPGVYAAQRKAVRLQSTQLCRHVPIYMPCMVDNISRKETHGLNKPVAYLHETKWIN